MRSLFDLVPVVKFSYHPTNKQSVKNDPFQLLWDLFPLTSRSDSNPHNVSFHHDTERRYMTMDVPGYLPEEISVEIEGGILYVEGRHESKDSDGKVWQNLNFSEAVTLTDDVDQNSLSADIKNGQLTISLVRKCLPKPEVKKFEVRSLNT